MILLDFCLMSHTFVLDTWLGMSVLKFYSKVSFKTLNKSDFISV